MKKKSWKTTIGGVVAAAGQAILLSGNTTWEWVGHALSGLGTLLLGSAARDSGVTSEQAGAK